LGLIGFPRNFPPRNHSAPGPFGIYLALGIKGPKPGFLKVRPWGFGLLKGLGAHGGPKGLLTLGAWGISVFPKKGTGPPGVF